MYHRHRTPWPNPLEVARPRRRREDLGERSKLYLVHAWKGFVAQRPVSAGDDQVDAQPGRREAPCEEQPDALATSPCVGRNEDGQVGARGGG